MTSPCCGDSRSNEMRRRSERSFFCTDDLGIVRGVRDRAMRSSSSSSTRWRRRARRRAPCSARSPAARSNTEERAFEGGGLAPAHPEKRRSGGLRPSASSRTRRRRPAYRARRDAGKKAFAWRVGRRGRSVLDQYVVGRSLGARGRPRRRCSGQIPYALRRYSWGQSPLNTRPTNDLGLRAVSSKPRHAINCA
jgi:hypothetical protein